jgi:hypothetical protein
VKNLVFVLLLIPQLLSAQEFSDDEFSGKITFLRRIIPKDHRIKADSVLDSYLGDSAIYTISGPYYKSTFYRKGKETYSYFYHHPEFRFYHILKSKNYITYTDSRSPDINSLISSITPYRDSIDTVAGYQVYKVEKVYEGLSTIGWYSDQLRIDPDRFKGHSASDWHYELTQTGGAISIRSISHYEQYTEIFEAVHITRKQLNPYHFSVPKGRPIVASADALDKQVELTITPEIKKCYKEKSRAIPTIHAGKETYGLQVLFVVTDRGEIQHINVMSKDPYGLHKIAIEVIRGCGLKPKPGEVNGKPVSSEYMMMLGFKI